MLLKRWMVVGLTSSLDTFCWNRRCRFTLVEKAEKAFWQPLTVERAFWIGCRVTDDVWNVQQGQHGALEVIRKDVWIESQVCGVLKGKEKLHGWAQVSSYWISVACGIVIFNIRNRLLNRVKQSTGWWEGGGWRFWLFPHCRTLLCVNKVWCKMCATAEQMDPLSKSRSTMWPEINTRCMAIHLLWNLQYVPCWLCNWTFSSGA